MEKIIVAAALGECVHVAGTVNFLRLAEMAGWKTIFLGPAVPIEKVIEVAKQEQAAIVGISYRLTPETGERLLAEFAESADDLHQSGVRFAFGGTPPIAEKARRMGFFERVFEGGEADDLVLAYLKGDATMEKPDSVFPQTTIERIQQKSPYPILRHHFGLPTLERTIKGIEKISESGVLDVISLGIDQDAQENFFNPEKQDPRRTGAGGVPVRTRQDYEALFQASRRGNYPLMRTYSGTDRFIELAELVSETIHNAWCAIPLFWFNKMDGRGPWDVEGSIREHQKVMAWYGARGIPVELNEPHHWGMRDAHDVVCVVSAYLSAYNARAFGVKDYIAQMMFNSPPGLSDAMDLAKMQAMMSLIEPLGSPEFRIWRQTRTGLLSYPLDRDLARAHLATSVYLQMAMKPHILHIVGFTEADHAAEADDVIESCKLSRRAVENFMKGAPDMLADPNIQRRINWLIQEAKHTLKAINDLSEDNNQDPMTDPHNLANAIKVGIMDAPQLRNNPYAPGRVKTRIINGACVPVNESGETLAEIHRLNDLLENLKGVNP